MPAKGKKKAPARFDAGAFDIFLPYSPPAAGMPRLF